MGRRPVCVLCLVLMTALCLADRMGMPLICGNPLPAELQSWLAKQSECSICGEVERCTDTENSQSVYLKEVYLIYDSKENSKKNSQKISIGNVRVFLKKKEKLPAGSLIVVSGKPEAVGAPRNPGEFDSRQYYACRGIYYFLKKAVVVKKSEGYSRYQQFLTDLRERLASNLRAAAGEAAPVFEAIVLGEKKDLETETKMRFQMAGILHILAISGLHISLLGMGLYELLKNLGLGIWPAGMISLVVMLNYGVMTGGSVSAMRAVVMFLISVGAKILGRIYDMLTALAVAAVLILAESPAYLLDGGFWMSFGAAAGIGVILPALLEIAGAEKKWMKALVSSVSVQAATAPLMLWFYGEVSLAGIFLNLLVLPTVGMVLLSGVCTALAGFAGTLAAFVCALPGRGLLRLYEFLGTLAGKIPFCMWTGGKPALWQIIIYYIILGMALWLGKTLKNRKRSSVRWIAGPVCAVGIAVGFMLLGYRSSPGFRITCLDVGQGDAIVMETPEKQVFLIDGGSSSKSFVGQYQLLPFLKCRGISRIDAVFVSHTDADHISGVLELLEYMGQRVTSVRASVLVLPGWENPPEEWERLKVLAEQAGLKVLTGNAGDVLRMEEAEFEILSPEKGCSGEDVNEGSLVLELRYDGFRGLFTGDAGADTEKKLLDRLLDVDFLKVGHHGSRYGTSDAFLEEIRPEIAVVSVSGSNTYGHPSPETLERLETAGCEVWCTKDRGAVTVRYDGERIFAEGYIR